MPPLGARILLTSAATGELEKRNSTFAFTLIEVLVMIAVVGVLAGILLPALEGSRHQARGAQCVDNLHQLGLATSMYWDDNDGQPFRYLNGSTNGGRLYWFGWLKPGPEGTREFDPIQGALYPWLQGSAVMICPSLDYSSTLYKYKAKGAACNYGYNLYLSRGSVPAMELQQPGETVVFADSAQVNDFQAPASPEHPLLEEFYYVDGGESADYPNAHFRHRTEAAVIMADSHTGREKPAPGSLDTRLPAQRVGRLRSEILFVP